MTLRIAVNGQRLAGQRFGVGRYIEYMLRYWADMLDSDELISLFIRRPLDADLLSLSPQIKPCLLASGLSGLPWETLRLRPVAIDHDVLFCPAYTAPLAYAGGLVVATHSVNEVQTKAHSWIYEQTHARLNRYCARQADAVIVPSISTRQLVVDRYGVPVEKVAVVNQGADDSFFPLTDEALLSQVRIRFFGYDRPYVLFVGKCSARRNIPLLLKAFAQVREKRGIPHGLVLFGPNQDELPLQSICESLGIADHVVQTDGVVEKHSDLVPVYSAATVFVHPSEFEGWSMTTVEAMACGVAVIAADRGGLGEVARGHALMVNPTIEEVSDAIGKVLEDDALRLDLQRRARERGQALRWRGVAEQTLNVVRGVARAIR